MRKAALSLVCFVLASFVQAQSPLHPTLSGKVVTGYQGWFRAEGDGTGEGWVHFGPGKRFGAGQYGFDLWPDLTELTAGERYPSPFKYADGRPAPLFSSANALTVRRHFRWMKDYGIDGAFVQRFGVEIVNEQKRKSVDLVLRHVTAAAIAEGRSVTVMYDLSGMKSSQFPAIATDWRRLLAAGQTKQPCVQLHEGKPLVALWGLGFKDRPADLQEWTALLKDIKATGAAVMIGIPTYWRELKNDSLSDPTLHDVIRLADILSPWTVGRIPRPEAVPGFVRRAWKPDMEWCLAAGKTYLPVISPGFSWNNLSKLKGEEARIDQIPRLQGRLLWSQAVAARSSGAKSLYVAMFDEIDEGTAIMKCGGPRPTGNFVDLSDVPTDHYLWLSGQAGRMLRGEIPASPDLPKR